MASRFDAGLRRLGLHDPDADERRQQRVADATVTDREIGVLALVSAPVYLVVAGVLVTLLSGDAMTLENMLARGLTFAILAPAVTALGQFWRRRRARTWLEPATGSGDRD